MKKKRWIGLGILLLSVFFFCCCDFSAGKQEEKTSDSEQTEAMKEGNWQDPAQKAIRERIRKAKETGEYDQVVFAFYAWAGRPAGTERIQERINEHIRETLGLEVEILILDSSSYAQNIRLMLTSGEQIDLWNSCPLGFSTVVNEGFCLNLEENDLIQTYGKGILDTIPAEYLDACRIGGILYGMPPMRDMAMGVCGYCIPEQYLEGIGFDWNAMYEEENEDIIYTDYDTIDEIFARLHARYPEKDVFSPSDNLFNQGSIVDNIGGDWFGVLLDPVHSLKVENLFTSQEFLEKCRRIYEWNQAGYVSRDLLTDDTTAGEYIQSGKLISIMSQTKPGYRNQNSAENGVPMVIFQTEADIMKSSALTSTLWHVNQNSEDPIAAIQLMEAFYTDPVLSNLLIWGEEGVDYVQTADGHIAFPQGISADNTEWHHSMNWLLPNQFIAHIWEGDSLDLWERVEAFNQKAQKSKALGFNWDNREYASTYVALKNVYDEYARQLMLGFVEPEEGIAVLQKELEAAGLNEYMEAKQRALEEWAEANGVR